MKDLTELQLASQRSQSEKACPKTCKSFDKLSLNVSMEAWTVSQAAKRAPEGSEWLQRVLHGSAIGEEKITICVNKVGAELSMQHGA